MFELEGKTALVTGSARNLGKAMVKDLANQGADVIVANRSSNSDLHQTVSEIESDYDVQVHGVQFDLTNSDSVKEGIQEARKEMGTIDILVNNVAVRPFQRYKDLTLKEWNHVIEVNLTGHYLVTKAVTPAMIDQDWGRVINISGMDAFTGPPNRLHVVTTKAGILGFTRALAQDLAPNHITSNCIVPGAFRTERSREWYPEGVEYENEEDYRRAEEMVYQNWREQIPLDRVGEPKDLSPMVVFLSSEEAEWITGQVFHVNGGQFPTHAHSSLELNPDK